MSDRWPVAIIGSGNIGTDLMIKVLRRARRLEMAAMVGIDEASDGLARARRLGVATTARGVDGLLDMPELDDIELVFDATSAGAHHENWSKLKDRGIRMIDLTPAAIGPYVVPVVNLDAELSAPNINMVTCGGQATVPIVAAVGSVAVVQYAEIVSSIASRSAGPGTRANIDEFTETTAKALEVVGGAARGKAVIVLNPAEPPLLMRNTVYCLIDDVDVTAVERAVEDMVERVRAYVPGYRLKQRVQFEHFSRAAPLHIPETGKFWGTRVSVFLEVTGAAHYLPEYAGNLDIMTSAALAAAERIAERAGVSAGDPALEEGAPV
ncbi:MAG: acetaldehyde dehydrogenase (acetylating) [Rhodococcus sp. (in: high G+C Gram-positive bacteria)]